MAHLIGRPVLRDLIPERAFARRTLRTALLCVAAAAAAPSPAATPPLEQAVKASYIFKFAPFIEWPSGSFAAPASPFVICLAGQDPFGPVIDEVVRGQKVAGRTIALRRVGSTVPAGCQILFLGRPAPSNNVPLVLTPGQPVLTITDAGSGVGGAIIQFVMQGGRVRFQIDDAGARANGLVISSKLLGLSIGASRP